jgi:methylmalonyl-CoA/ethylmalonyl-CoA epimerase
VRGRGARTQECEVYVNSPDEKGKVTACLKPPSVDYDWLVGLKAKSTRPVFSRIKVFRPSAAADGRRHERWPVVEGVDNIGICTTDLTGSVAFYERLGFSEAYRNDRGVMMAAGAVQLFLFQGRRRDAAPVDRELGLFGNPPGIDHVSFAVSDVDVVYAELCKAGVALSGPPENQPWGARMVGLKDPDGNNLYLLQRL